MEAVRSRCLAIRVPAPSSAEVGVVLEHVAKKEGLTLPQELAARVGTSLLPPPRVIAFRWSAFRLAHAESNTPKWEELP
jgi:hypothetical protein